MIVCYTDSENIIRLRWRDEEGNRKSEDVSDFRPYFFIKSDEMEYPYYTVKQGRTKVAVNYQYEHGDWVNLNGQSLKKVIVEKSYDMKTAKSKWQDTYEADVKFHYRYCVDKLHDMPEYKLKKWYWDMEWLPSEHEHGDAITTIVMYDNYTEKYTTYVWFPEERLVEFSESIRVFNTEQELLLAFAGDMMKADPDMLIAWFGLKFDLPKLIERMAHNSIDPRILSPYHEVKGVGFRNSKFTIGKAVNNYGPIQQPIRGRITLNLDLAFERQWNDAQRGTLPSLSLDYISTEVLGEKKLVSEKFPDKNEFFLRAWLEDTETYLDYAKKDVELMVRIDEENYTSEAILSLQRLLKAPFDACFYASNMGSIYFMRNATWKASTGKKVENRVEYEGAMIYDPLSEGTNGLHFNVAAFDFAGLYPSMMVARNISWETKSVNPTEFAVNILTPRDFSECKHKSMLYYKTDKLGLLPSAVLELKELRNDYKRRMKEAYVKEDKAEYAKWNNNQMAVKRLMASFYGVTAFQGFGWADVDIAASITASAREAIREAAFKAKEMN